MSRAVEQVTEVESKNGAAVAAPRARSARPGPALPFVAPLAAFTAAVVAARVARRRRQAAKPSVYWSFSMVSGNRVTFRPTLAPRFGSVILRGAARRFGARPRFRR